MRARKPITGPTDQERRRRELEQAERWLTVDPAQRRLIARALVVALAVHAVVLVARMPDWGPRPVRVDAPVEEPMKIQFLTPPPPKAPPKPPEPEKKRIPKPDPTPDKPEPKKEAPPPLAPPEDPPGPPAPPAQTGPVRVAAGQGPGLIKKVEPIYPPIARTARMEGTVVVDAIILKDGTVSDVKVLSSSNQIFNQSVIDAVRQWRYTPGNQDVILTVTVNFSLR
ncbi:MAG TPA: energy transducer TonB [Vicinamibacterales bacterium]|nr:energy transducer TonB [Vicinamibacterales bacterium]